jgi:membrane protein implicated in regulation of membrane protease activity
MLVDALIVMESFAVALLFRFAGEVPGDFWRMFWPFAVFSALAFVLLLNVNRVYQSIPRQAEPGLYQDVRVLSATAIAAGGLFIAVFAIGPFGLGIMKEVNPVPLSVPLVGSVFAYVQLVAVRLFDRARGSRTVN